MDPKAVAESIKATAEAVKIVADLVKDAERSVVIEVNNTSSRTMILRHTHSEWGGFSGGAPPPDPIRPLSTYLFAHATTGILTGCEGYVDYLIPDGRIQSPVMSFPDDPYNIPPTPVEGSVLSMQWSNPMAGANTFSSSFFPSSYFEAQFGEPIPDWYFATTFTGDGSNAYMRVIFGELADFGPNQPDWLPCGACKSLVYALDASSKCPSNSYDSGIEDQQGNHLFRFGKHAVAGSAFRLPESRPGAYREPGWRKCTNCKSLFYDGYPDKGVCVGRPMVNGVQNRYFGHMAEGPDFHLAFDMPVRPWQQRDWRWCDKCFELFYFPQNEDAECAAGEHHHAHPYNYVLDYA